MNYSRSLGALLTVSVNVAHNVVADFLFAGFRNVIVDVVDMSFKLVYLLLCYGQTELHFAARQSYPELSPGRELLVRGEDVLHFGTCIAGAKRAFI